MIVTSEQSSCHKVIAIDYRG